HDAFRERMRVIDDLSGFTQEQPADQRLFGSWLNLLPSLCLPLAVEKALNGSGLAENMRRNGQETA
ncbi:hypothetical protein, partial [Leisingera sp. ANG-S]|uniref:hypothetical protein n=1 Tax=Leisingera sp. ANG-S TaxID=1577898 RepID=UPI0019D338C2